MSSFRRYLVNAIVAILPPTRLFAFKRFLWRSMGVSVGHRVQINAGASIWGVGALSVGEGAWLGMNLVVIVPAGARVVIGANVNIAPDVLIECGSHVIGGTDRRAGRGTVADVTIGAGTWIGCRATLLGGTKLGTGTVVGAGAVVLPGAYADNALLVGVPARVSRTLDKEGLDA